jgi:hypothetical protein
MRPLRKGTVRKATITAKRKTMREEESPSECICKEKVDRKTYPPCNECGVRGCNIHQIVGWARPPSVAYRADCPVHGKA